MVSPVTWLLLSRRSGERSQILALGEALGWPCEVKELRSRPWQKLLGLARRAGFSGLEPDARRSLGPPWPDLVISAGLVSEPVARELARQGERQTRLVHIGRSWAPVSEFDLLVTTPQYRVRPHQRVLQNATTLHRVTRERLAAAGEAWRERLAHLPRPYTALIVGGSSGPYCFDAPVARCLADQTNRLMRQLGGSLLVTTSARTPASVAASLLRHLRDPRFIYQWQPNDANNPYYAFLALADCLVVTADSVSMASEACATGKPVFLFDLDRRMAPGPWSPARLRAFLYEQMMRFGPQRLSRDLRLVHRILLDQGRVAWLGQPLPEHIPPTPEDMARTVRAVRDLFPGATS